MYFVKPCLQILIQNSNGNKIDTSRLNVFLNLVEELVKKEQKDVEIEEFIKVAQKRLDYEEEMLKEMENEMKAEFDEDFYTE